MDARKYQDNDSEFDTEELSSNSRDRVSTEDGHRSGRPKTSVTDEEVDAIQRMVLEDRRLTVQQITKCIGIRSILFHSVLTEIFGIKTDVEMVDIARTLLTGFQADPENLHARLVT